MHSVSHCQTIFTLAKFAAKMPATVTMAAHSLATLGRMTQIRLLLFIAALPKETKVSAVNVIVGDIFAVNFAYLNSDLCTVPHNSTQICLGHQTRPLSTCTRCACWTYILD